MELYDDETRGYILLADIIRAARAGKPYKQMIDELKPVVETNLKVKQLVFELIQALERK